MLNIAGFWGFGTVTLCKVCNFSLKPMTIITVPITLRLHICFVICFHRVQELGTDSKASLSIFQSSAPARSGMNPSVNKLSYMGGHAMFFLKPKAFCQPILTAPVVIYCMCGV